MSKLSEIRRAIAYYISSEGCSCCSDYEKHKLHKNALGKLLGVPMFEDKSGYDFSKIIQRA